MLNGDHTSSPYKNGIFEILILIVFPFFSFAQILVINAACTLDINIEKIVPHVSGF